MTASASLKTAWISWGRLREPQFTRLNDLANVARAEGRAMTLEQAIEYALASESN